MYTYVSLLWGYIQRTYLHDETIDIWNIFIIDNPHSCKEIWISVTRREKSIPSQIYDNGYNPSISYPLWMLFIYKRFWITFNSRYSPPFFGEANVAGTLRCRTIGLTLLLSHFSLTQSSWSNARKQWFLGGPSCGRFSTPKKTYKLLRETIAIGVYLLSSYIFGRPWRMIVMSVYLIIDLRHFRSLFNPLIDTIHWFSLIASIIFRLIFR